MGTIFLPGLLLLLDSSFLFGYAKPVPINFRALRNPRRLRRASAAASPTDLTFPAALHSALLLVLVRGTGASGCSPLSA